MKIVDSVRRAVDDWHHGELESAMLHACNAVDGTARKAYPSLGSNARFTRLLRETYAVFGPMGAPGINLVETRFPVALPRAKAPGAKPDIADVIYGIHRCSHGHGDELPDGFALIPDAAGPARHTRLQFAQGRVRLSDRAIFGLLAVAVMHPVNSDQASPALSGYYLTYGASVKLVINEWWGRAADFPAVAATDPVPSVRLDFGPMMP
jgi:hypothetical protein